MTKMNKGKRKRRKKKASTFKKTMLAMVVVSVIAFSGYIYIKANDTSGVINNNVYVESIGLGGKTFEEAETLLQERYGQVLASKKVEVRSNNKTYVLDYSDVEVRYDISETVTKAINHGKEKTILDKIFSKKSEERKDFSLSLKYNSKAIEEFIDAIENETNKDAGNAKVSITRGEVLITPEVKGVKLQRNALKEAIEERLKEGIHGEDSLIQAVVEEIIPEVTAEKLSAANTRISSFNTDFSTSNANRIANIELSLKAINGTTLMPGETFSFNGVVGQRTAARGYKEAGVIIGDRIESGIGGGICQVSSTLYNAVLSANLKPTERRNHTLPLSYVPKGLDATVDWGNIDFKFKNTLNVPIYIEGYTNNKKVYINIYSDKALVKRTYKLETDVYQTIEPAMSYVDDPDLDEGEIHIVNPGSPGYRVRVYRKAFEDGKLIATELISNDYYMPVRGEAVRGTRIIEEVEPEEGTEVVS
jgi:vancomycin resistance protein YoaR